MTQDDLKRMTRADLESELLAWVYKREELDEEKNTLADRRREIDELEDRIKYPLWYIFWNALKWVLAVSVIVLYMSSL